MIQSQWGRKADLSSEKALSLGEVPDVESLRRADLVPFNIGQGSAVPGVEHADHLAEDPGRGFACGQPVSDAVADLDFI